LPRVARRPCAACSAVSLSGLERGTDTTAYGDAITVTGHHAEQHRLIADLEAALDAAARGSAPGPAASGEAGR
jgi:hypothetical protein